MRPLSVREALLAMLRRDAGNASPSSRPFFGRHGDLARLGETCADKVAILLATAPKGAIGRVRGWVRAQLREELEEIDALAKRAVRSSRG